jgi:hypothetical protein
MLATIVDTKALLQTIAVSLGAGVGVTLVFSIAIYAAARFAELRRADRIAAAAVSGALMVVALATCAAAVTLGIVIMTQK